MERVDEVKVDGLAGDGEGGGAVVLLGVVAVSVVRVGVVLEDGVFLVGGVGVVMGLHGEAVVVRNKLASEVEGVLALRSSRGVHGDYIGNCGKGKWGQSRKTESDTKACSDLRA